MSTVHAYYKIAWEQVVYEDGRYKWKECVEDRNDQWRKESGKGYSSVSELIRNARKDMAAYRKRLYASKEQVEKVFR